MLIICPKCDGEGYDKYKDYVDYLNNCNLCDGKGVVEHGSTSRN